MIGRLIAHNRHVGYADLDWLVAAREVIRKTVNADLVGLRDEEHLNELPDPEQAACRRLWAAVNALIERAGG